MYITTYHMAIIIIANQIGKVLSKVVLLLWSTVSAGHGLRQFTIAVVILETIFLME